MTPRSSHRLLSRVFARARLLLVLLVLAVPALLTPIAFIAPLSSAAALAFAIAFCAVVAPVFLSPTTVDVGRDGVSLRWVGRTRFVAFREIAEARVYETPFGTGTTLSGAVIVLRSGEEIRLPTSGALDDDATTLANEINDALTAYDATTEHDDVSSILRRGERGMGEWVASLRAMGAGSNVAFREAPVDEHLLWSIVESPSAKREDRAAAAIALRAAQREDAPQRLRIAAESIAEPRLRVFVETVAIGDDATIEAALRSVAK